MISQYVFPEKNICECKTDYKLTRSKQFTRTACNVADGDVNGQNKMKFLSQNDILLNQNPNNIKIMIAILYFCSKRKQKFAKSFQSLYLYTTLYSFFIRT